MTDSYIGPHLFEHEKLEINKFLCHDAHSFQKYLISLTDSKSKNFRHSYSKPLFGSALQTYIEESSLPFFVRSTQVLDLLEKQGGTLLEATSAARGMRYASMYVQDLLGYSAIQWTLANTTICQVSRKLSDNLFNLEKEKQVPFDSALVTSYGWQTLLKTTFGDTQKSLNFFSAVDRWRLYGPSFGSYVVTMFERASKDHLSSQSTVQNIHNFHNSAEALLKIIDKKRRKDISMLCAKTSLRNKELILELENFDLTVPIHPEIN